MTDHTSLADRAAEINATANKVAAGKLMIEVKAQLVAGAVGWAKWAAANLERSERACQRCIQAAREAAADKARHGLITPVDLVIAEQGPLPPVVGKPTKPHVAMVDPQEDVGEPAVGLPVDAPALQVVAEIEDTWEEEPVGYPTEDVAEPALTGDVVTDLAEATEPPAVVAEEPATAGKHPAPVVDTPEPDPPTVDEQDVAEFDVVYTEVADEPEPTIQPIPRGAQAVANAYLALPPGRWRHECLAWVEAGCPGDWLYFIADLQAREATLELRHEAAYYTNDQTRQAFARWARSLEPRRAA